MKLLGEHFRKNDFDYYLRERDDRTAIYAQYNEDRLMAYEVFKIKVSPAKTIKGTYVPEGESIPGNEEFGTSAFTYQHYPDALEKYRELQNRERT
jgi:hypothetical protein